MGVADHMQEEKKDNMKRLEGVVHALVKEERLRFLRNSIEAQEKLVVLDVPLLFETKMDSQVLMCSTARNEQRGGRSPPPCTFHCQQYSRSRAGSVCCVDSYWRASCILSPGCHRSIHSTLGRA